MKEKKVSRYFIERYILGELDEKEKANIEKRIKSDVYLQQTIDQIRHETDFFNNQYANFYALEQKLILKKRYLFWEKIKAYFNTDYLSINKLAFASILSCVLLIIFVFTDVLKTNITSPKVIYRPKGENVFQLYVKRNNEIKSVLNEKFICQEQDTLQFIIISEKPLYYAILGLNKDNQLIKYLPLQDKPQVTYGKNESIVPQSLIIDENWQGETLYCVYSEESFLLSDIQDLIKSNLQDKPSSINIMKFVLVRE